MVGHSRRDDSPSVVVLAGGTGGAKLARGFLDVVGPANLSVVANTGDDFTLHGLRISPDPDLVTYWLADMIDADRGWGFAGETFHMMERLASYGADGAWFGLGDRDLATHIHRTNLLRSGATPTQAQAAIARGLGVEAAVLPMSDSAVETYVRTASGWIHFVEFMVKHGAKPPLEDVEFRGADRARPSAEVERAVARADIVVIGPSNPVASIAPILAVAGMRDALRTCEAPVIAVSPLVAGRVVKGPTAKFMALVGRDLDHRGICAHYEDLVDGLVCDDVAAAPPIIPSLEEETDLSTPSGRKATALAVIDLAVRLRGTG